MAEPKALPRDWQRIFSAGRSVSGRRLGASPRADLFLAGFIVSVVALFILPLPQAALDGMISLNLAASVVLLTVSTYVPSAVSFSSFPALLLFTTLFRLALNIASCKLILLHANAGHVIDAFGRLVVGNNVVVGGVVFLVIAVVQFIVIAKGSERVAEVGARFSLDAMPGKQMSIDADLRAGIISADEARERREKLEQESQMHGAMDGAMKFVKGDAIAGLVIAFINIVAGIAVGTLMHGMDIGEALQRYAILTVGDGMASQIPSLLVSIAAGIVTTRVATRDTRQRQLGEQLGEQLGAHPRALLIAALVLAGFLVVPGFPKWSFALIAIGLGAFAFTQLKRKTTAPSFNLIHIAGRIGATDDGQPAKVSHAAGVTSLIAVSLSDDLRTTLNLAQLQAALSSAKARVDADIGTVFPRITLNDDEGAPAGTYRIYLQDVLAAQGALKPGWLLWDGVAPLPERAERQPAEAFGPFATALWIKPDGAAPEGKWLTSEGALAAHVEQIVRQHADELIGIQETQALVHLVRREHPELVGELTRLVPLQRVTEVLRRLLAEQVPIRNLRVIFESLITWAPNEPDDVIALVELVRVDLRRMITDRHAGAARQLRVVLFEQNLQERIENAVMRTKQGNFLALSSAIKQDIGEQVRAIVQAATSAQAAGAGGHGNPQGAARLAVMVALGARRYVKTILQPVLPDLAVLSYQEIEEDVQLHTVGWVKNPPDDGTLGAGAGVRTPGVAQ
ncbi:type III secretion protein [Burkholderia territorii]|uniref:Type III secretion protein n=3 Tax=Burkholderia territorii TaxID=1503055 RepID=A0A124T6X2_9BURK|nr:type III secretion system export apparatus subunit SctV [Burkholderia territorii]KVL38930.1 type III secretion protein [Burkholderia territorii]KVQ55302.1 type III secretion protein [Burkholderia territorii]KWA21402.1 type III secretion protein [Burkholderia territorii]KWA36444.1 type III secretion protein [Burkholderia territorii]KWN07981.1 type III secretion protein [Burkholderia territorii]